MYGTGGRSLTIHWLDDLQAADCTCMTSEDVRARASLQIPDSERAIRTSRDQRIANILQSPNTAFMTVQSLHSLTGDDIEDINEGVI